MSIKLLIIIIFTCSLYFILLDFFSKNPIRNYFQEKLGSILDSNTSHSFIDLIEGNSNLASGFIASSVVAVANSLPVTKLILL